MAVRVRHHKIREWIRRYLPLEVSGTITAVVAAYIAQQCGYGPLAIALVATLGENVGYYSVAAIRELRIALALVSAQSRRDSTRHATGIVARNLVLEFGAAELIDTCLTRPFLMYRIPELIGNFGAGVAAGKLLSDVVFYVFAIGGFELRKRLITDGTDLDIAASE